MDREEAIELLRDRDSTLNRARMAFRSESARIEQALAQRRGPDPMDVVRMEFEAVVKIVKAFNGQS